MVGMFQKVGAVLNVEPKARQQTMSCEYPIAVVEWADACGGDPGWLTLEDVEDDGETLVTSVGFLIPPEDPGGKKDHVTLLQTYHDGDGINLFHIPAAMVRKISVVTP